ncbi:glycine/D-amino acid oxidase-like deaminating enzyme [Agromyces cerinus]|uniref:NAD(P)/FAD-dependent oxidoreductase n=1 Tax=Agromyces cerinus TaxID=33878 RepID=UPI0027DE71C8|nr:FAD-dependent oxidoreductase [Agromyces cerinus]MBM7832240.1 glycine/D-amino acid oxidase-like deaminating enzyme [Agromyces cerinus]
MNASQQVADAAAAALVGAAPKPYWMDRADAPALGAPLSERVEADLVVIGGGFTGLWTAWRALERDPGASVVVLEADRVAHGATGRNGGFVASSLTHGLTHGTAIWPDQVAALAEEGDRNLAELIATIEAAGIDCDLRRSGKTTLAVEEWQLAGLREAQELGARHGVHLELQSRDEVQADVHSPSYLGGLRDRTGTVLVDPARLAWGMAADLRRRGVRIFEASAATGIETNGAGVRVRTALGHVDARHAVIATAAYPAPLKRLGSYIMPLYDHVLMTEPLTEAQQASIGWGEGQGLTDAGNQFHYYRPTADGRILFGGWDAVYYYGGKVDASLEQRDSSHELLARHFFETFPQLGGLRFTHRWAGPIDSTTRFTAAYGTARGGRVAYAVGHTGLGVGASRFSADVALDLLSGEPTSRLRYDIVRRRPFPIPPEPFRNPIIQFTRHSILSADAHEGRRNLWLRTLDRFGLGFNS